VSVLANGWEGNSRLFQGIQILKGRSLRPDDGKVVMLGRVLQMNLAKDVGEDLDLSGVTFRVIGIFESESLFENGGLIVPLQELQQMMGRVGQVTGFVVAARSSDRAEVSALARRIEEAVPGVAAVPARDFVQSDLQIRLTRTMAWATTAVALVLGSIGLLNTMVMTVFERTGEVGLLRALGWRRRRILTLILGEALCIGGLGAMVGILLALLGVRALMLDPTARGFIDPDLPPSVMAIGLAMGVILSLLGGLYPALRAAALDPTEALRHD
jgi:putative ABC transport system permease protein